MCVYSWWHDSWPWDGHTSCMSAVFLLGRGELQGQSQEKEELNSHPSFQFPPAMRWGFPRF